MRGSIPVDVLAPELAERLAVLQRSLRRRTRAALGGPGLSPAEVELLRLVARRPGVRVGDAAVELRLAPNTVSTLARRLGEDGLLRAERERSDRRGVRLETTAAAKRRMRRWRDERAHLLAGALERLSGAERDAVAACLPILTALVESLEDDAEP